jgi:hypothetical protein
MDAGHIRRTLMKQKITLSLEKDLLNRAKLMATRKDMSVTRLLAEQLAKLVSEDDQYEAAKKRALTILKKGFHLGGCVIAKREELHERR